MSSQREKDPCIGCPYYCDFNGCMLPDYRECPKVKHE